MAGLDFRYLEFTNDFAVIIFAVTTSIEVLWESNFAVALTNNFFHDPILWFLEINTFLLERNNQWSREDVVQKTVYQTKFLIFVHQFLKNFVGINFCDSRVLRVNKEIEFCDFGQIPRNLLNFLPAKMSSLNG